MTHSLLNHRLYKNASALLILLLAFVISVPMPAYAQAPEPVPAVQPTRPGIPDDLVISNMGFVLLYVAEGSPADLAGLRVGNVVLAVNGVPVDRFFRVWNLISDARPGDALVMTVRADDEVVNRTVIAGSRDDRGRHGDRGHHRHRRDRSAWFGVVPFPVWGQHPGAADTRTTIEDGMICNSSKTWAISVSTVNEGSPAEEAGIAPGDMIVSIGGRQVDPETSPLDIVESYRPGDTVDVHVFFLSRYNALISSAVAATESADAEATGTPEEETTGEGSSGEVEASEETLDASEIETILTVTMGTHPVFPERGYLGILGVPMVYSESQSCSGSAQAIPVRPGSSMPGAAFPGMNALLPACADGEGEIAMVVDGVLPRSPAFSAGLMPGDAILGINTDALPHDVDARNLLAGYAPGDTIILRVLHLDAPEGSFEEPVTATLTEHPDDPSRGFLGLSGYQTVIADGEECMPGLIPMPMPATGTPSAEDATGTAGDDTEATPESSEDSSEDDESATPLPTEPMTPTVVPEQTPTATPTPA